MNIAHDVGCEPPCTGMTAFRRSEVGEQQATAAHKIHLSPY